MMMASFRIVKTDSVLVCPPAGHRLSQAPSEPRRTHAAEPRPPHTAALSVSQAEERAPMPDSAVPVVVVAVLLWLSSMGDP